MAAILNSSVYQRLSRNPEIVEVDSPNTDEIGDKPDVGMDSYAITKKGILCTSGVHSCFAVCCQGRKITSGQTLLAMAHASLQPLCKVYHILSRDLLRKGCDPATLKTYVVGGMVLCEGEPSSCPEEEQDILDRADECHLVGVRFNVVEGADESLSVVFTPDRVRFGREDLFQSTEEIGKPLES